jgi:hypothetical protein
VYVVATEYEAARWARATGDHASGPDNVMRCAVYDSRELVGVPAAGCPMSHQGGGLPIGERGTRGRVVTVTCSRR